MSNRYNGKIIVIDTTNTQIGGPEAAGGPKGNLNILAIKWVNTPNSGKDIVADDDLGIKFNNKGGDYVIECRAEGGQGGTAVSNPNGVAYSAEFSHPGWIVPGLYIEDLDGGELQIFLA